MRLDHYLSYEPDDEAGEGAWTPPYGARLRPELSPSAAARR